MNGYGDPQYACEQGAASYGWYCEPGHCRPRPSEEPAAVTACGCEHRGEARGYEYPPPRHDADPCDCSACVTHLSRTCECSLPSESAVVPLQFPPQQHTLEYPCDCASHASSETCRCGYAGVVRRGMYAPPYACCSPSTERVTSQQRDAAYIGPGRALQDEGSLDNPASSRLDRDSERSRFTSELVPPHTPVNRKVRFFEEIGNDGSKNHNQVSERKVTEVCKVVEERCYHLSTLDIQEEEFTSSFQNRQGFTTFSSLANESRTNQPVARGLHTLTSTGITQRRQPSSPLNTDATDCVIVTCDNQTLDCEYSKKLDDLEEKKYKLGVSTTLTKHEGDDGPRGEETSNVLPTAGVNGRDEGGAEYVTRLCTRLQGVILNRYPWEENTDAPQGESEQAAVFNTDDEPAQLAPDGGDFAESAACDRLENGTGVECSQRDSVSASSGLQKQSALPLVEIQEDVSSQQMSICGSSNDEVEKAPKNKQNAQTDHQSDKQHVAGRKQQHVRALRTSLVHDRHEICKPNAPGKSVKRNHDDVVPTFRNLDKPKDPYANDGQTQYKYKSKMNFSNLFESDLDSDDKDIHIVYQRKGNSTERKEIDKLNHDVTELKIKLNELQFRQQTLDPLPLPKKVIKKAVKKLSPRKRPLKKRKVISLGPRRTGSSLDEVCARGKNKPSMTTVNAESSDKNTMESSIPRINTEESYTECDFSKPQSGIPSSLIRPLLDSTEISICSKGNSCNEGNEEEQKSPSVQKTGQMNPTDSLSKPNEEQHPCKAGKRDECGKEKKRPRESNESNTSLEGTAIVHECERHDVPCGEEERAQATCSDQLFTKCKSNQQDNDMDSNVTHSVAENQNQRTQNALIISKFENEQLVEVDMKSPNILPNVCNKVGGSCNLTTGTSNSFHVDLRTVVHQAYRNMAPKTTTSESSSSDIERLVVSIPVNAHLTAQTDSTNNNNNNTTPVLQSMATKPHCLLIDISGDNLETTGELVITEHPNIKSSEHVNPTTVQDNMSGTTNGNAYNKQHLPEHPVLEMNTNSTANSSSQQTCGPAAGIEQHAANGSTLLKRQEDLKHQASNSLTAQRQTNTETQTFGQKPEINSMQRSVLACQEQLTRPVDTRQTFSSKGMPNTARNPQETPLVTTIPANQSKEMISYITSSFPHPYGFVSVPNPNMPFLPPNNMQVPIGYMQPPPIMFQTSPQLFSQYLPFQPQKNLPTCNYEHMPSAVEIDGNVFISTPSYAYNPTFPPVITPYPRLNDGRSFSRQQPRAQTSSSARGKSVGNKAVPNKRDVDTLKYPGSIFMASGPHLASSQNLGLVGQDHSFSIRATHGFTQVMQPPTLSGTTNQSLPSPALNVPSVKINRAGRYQQTNHPLPSSSVNVHGVKAFSRRPNHPLPSCMNMQGVKVISEQTNHAPPSAVNMQGVKASSHQTNHLPPSSVNMQGLKASSHQTNHLPPSSVNMQGVKPTFHEINGPPHSIVNMQMGESIYQQTSDYLQPPEKNMQSLDISPKPITPTLQQSATNMQGSNSNSQQNNEPLQPSGTSLQGRNLACQPISNSLESSAANVQNLPSKGNIQDGKPASRPSKHPLQPQSANVQGRNQLAEPTSHPLLLPTAYIQGMKISSQPKYCGPFASATNIEGVEISSESRYRPLESTAANVGGGNSKSSGHDEAASKSILSSTVSRRGQINRASMSCQKSSQPMVSTPGCSKSVSSSGHQLCISSPTYDVKANDESNLKKTNEKIPSLTLEEIKDANSNSVAHSKKSNQSSLTSLSLRPSLVHLNKVGRSKSLRCQPSSASVESARSHISSNCESSKKSLTSSSTNRQGLHSKCIISHAPLDLMKELQISDVPKTRKKAPTQLMLSAVLKRQGITFKGDSTCKLPDKPMQLASLTRDIDKNVITLYSSCDGTSLGKQLNKSNQANSVPNAQQSTSKENDSFRNQRQHKGTRTKYQVEKDVGQNVQHTCKNTACDEANPITVSKEGSRHSEPNPSHRTTSSFLTDTRKSHTRLLSEGGGTLRSKLQVIPTKKFASCSHTPRLDLISAVGCNGQGEYLSQRNVTGDKYCGKEMKMHLPVKAIPLRDPTSTNKKTITQVVGKEEIQNEKPATLHSSVTFNGALQDKSDVTRTQLQTNTHEHKNGSKGEAEGIWIQHQADCEGVSSREGVIKSKLFQGYCDRTKSKDGVTKIKLSHRYCEESNSTEGLFETKLSQKVTDSTKPRDGVVKAKLSHKDCDRASSRGAAKLPHKDCDNANSGNGKLSQKYCDRNNSRGVYSNQTRGDCNRAISRDAVVKPISFQGHSDYISAGCDNSNTFQGVWDITKSRDGGIKTKAVPGDCRSSILPTSKQDNVKKHQVKSKETHPTDRSDSRVDGKQLEVEGMGTCSTSGKESPFPRRNEPGGKDSEASERADDEDEPPRRRSQSPNKPEGRKRSKHRQRSSWGHWYNRRGISQRTIEHMDDLCTEIWNDGDSFEFRHDVDFRNVVDYVSIVKQPLCLTDIRSKLKRYAYRTVDQFVHDLRRLVFNSRLYNARNSELGKVTTSLETKINKLVYEVFERNFSHITGDPLETDTNPDLQYTLFTGL